MTEQTNNPLEDSTIRSERENAMLACLRAITKFANAAIVIDPMDGDDADDIEEELIYDGDAHVKVEAFARTYKILSETSLRSHK